MIRSVFLLSPHFHTLQIKYICRERERERERNRETEGEIVCVMCILALTKILTIVLLFQ